MAARWTLRLTRRLVELKKANPDKVFLINGNRDLNKLRFGAELQGGITGPWWEEGIFWDTKVGCPRHVACLI